MRLASIVLVCSVMSAAEPSLFFSKVFPGSTPDYVSVTLEKSGAAEYKEAADDERPLKLQLSAAETAEMFALADKLDHFKRPLESALPVAKMGMKTFRFEDGAGKTEASFNFSEDLDARALLDLFERVSETGQNYWVLERAVKYDKLGVNQALLQFTISMERKRIVSPQVFLPLLDRVAKNDSYMNMARSRAGNLAETIRAEK